MKPLLNRSVGYRALRPGCIHLLCPRCGRKQSNTKRTQYDPAKAFVAVLYCPNCIVGGFSEGPDDYLYKNGKSIPQLEDGCGWVHEPPCRRAFPAAPKRREK